MFERCAFILLSYLYKPAESIKYTSLELKQIYSLEFDCVRHCGEPQ